MTNRHCISVKVCNQFHAVEYLLHIVFRTVQLLIADTVDSKGIAGVPDDLGGVLHEHLRIIQEILPPAALLEDFRDYAASRQRLPV